MLNYSILLTLLAAANRRAQASVASLINLNNFNLISVHVQDAQYSLELRNDVLPINIATKERYAKGSSRLY
jgi:hypothetical protein